MRGSITGLDGMIGIYIFSIASVVMLAVYAQAVNSASTSVISHNTQLKAELGMQHTVYIIDNSNQTLSDILGGGNGSVYDYVRVGANLTHPIYNNSKIDRIAVSDGQLYIISVNG